MATKCKCAGLILENHGSVCTTLFKTVSQIVEEVLYIPLPFETCKDAQALPVASQLLSDIYRISSQCAGHVDVRPLFLPPSGVDSKSLRTLSNCQDTILTRTPWVLENLEGTSQFRLLDARQKTVAGVKPSLETSALDGDQTWPIETPLSASKAVLPIKMYNSVAVGGTFDRFHNGHRLFLAQAVLRAQKRILVGMADGPLLVNKTLAELIQTAETRAQMVREFLSDMKPWLQIDVVPISDVFGPTATDGSLECLVITPDSAKGGDAVNVERSKRGHPSMSIEVVDMVGLQGGLTEEVNDKLSSTDLRRQLLGKFGTPSIDRSLPPPLRGEPRVACEGPFILGLTGGTASGKSSIAERLAGLGAYTVDCDKLGHKAYIPGTTAFQDIAGTFGRSVVGTDGLIDRKALGGIVFASKDEMKKLTDIVWPEILRLAKKEIADASIQGFKVCVLDAAVLLESEWDRHCHEVWVTVIPPKEALRRVVERDGVTQEAAARRMAAQLPSKDKVSHAHVVLSTFWEPDETQRQVEESWKLLQERIAQNIKSSL